MPKKQTKQAQRAHAKGSRKQEVVIEKLSGPGRYKAKAQQVSVVAAPPPPASDYDSIGGKIGAFVGNGLQGLIKRITGFGEYDINKNTIMNKGGSPPEFITKGGAVEVSHREYIRDISGSTTFTNTPFAINPGDPTTFPFVSQIAANFEEYEMLGLVFEFNTTSGDTISSSPTLGVVVAATSYNPSAPLFTDKRVMESTLFVDSCKPSRSLLHPVECDPSLSQYQVRKVRTPQTIVQYDLDQYDMGKFQLATIGMPTVYVVGELWVTYHIRLLKPRLLDSDQNIDMLSARDGGTLAAAALYNGPSMGTAPTWIQSGRIRYQPTPTQPAPLFSGVLGGVAADCNFYFPSGTYFAYLSATLAGADTFTVTGNGIGFVGATNVSSVILPTPVGGNTVTQVYRFTIPASSAPTTGANLSVVTAFGGNGSSLACTNAATTAALSTAAFAIVRMNALWVAPLTLEIGTPTTELLTGKLSDVSHDNLIKLVELLMKDQKKA